jgi:hypothetical protein
MNKRDEESSDIEALRAKLDAGRDSDLTGPVTSETFEELRLRATRQADEKGGQN